MKTMTLWWIAATCVVAGGCSGDDSTNATAGTTQTTAGPTSGPGGAGGGTSSGGAAGAPTGGAGGAGSGGGSAIPACTPTCSTPADCVQPNSQPPFDRDNWTCDAGLCHWLGCLSDEECKFFGGVCRADHVIFGGVKACTEACQGDDASVCAEALKSVDADNWTCPDGGCNYIGCLTDEECIADDGPGSKCMPSAVGPPACVHGCSQAMDCVSPGAGPAFDADNWACTGGLCVYLGCLSDQDCPASSGGALVCAP